MKITQTKFHEINKDKLKAYATITIDDELVIRGLKVMDSVNGYFVAMPSRKNTQENNGNTDYKAYIDTVYPITKEAHKYIQDEVLLRYKEFMESNEPNFINEEAKEVYERVHRNTPSIDINPDDLPF